MLTMVIMAAIAVWIQTNGPVHTIAHNGLLYCPIYGSGRILFNYWLINKLGLIVL